MPHDLDRFVKAQFGGYDSVLAELRRGQKTGHWIWYIFPQLAGLGHSDVSRYYGIASLDEAKAYVTHPVLGPRLRECAAVVLSVSGRTANEIMGSTDAMKLRSCMTLFHRAAPDEPLFREVLVRYYDGVADSRTDALLGLVPGQSHQKAHFSARTSSAAYSRTVPTPCQMLSGQKAMCSAAILAADARRDPNGSGDVRRQVRLV